MDPSAKPSDAALAPQDEQTPQTPQARPPRRWARRLLLLAAALVLGAGLLLAAGYGALQTTWGREALARKVEALTAASDTTRVHLSDLGPGLPWSLAAGRIALADAKGEWLVLQGPALQLTPWSLLRGHVRLSLVAQEIQVLRRPESPDDDAPASMPDLPALLRSLPHIRIEKLSVPRLVLAQGVAGDAAVLALDGGLSSFRGRVETRLEVRRLEGPEELLQLRSLLDLPDDRGHLELTLHSPADGLLSRTLGLPAGMDGNLLLDGPLEALAGTLRAEAPGMLAASAELRLAAKAPYGADIRAVVTPGNGMTQDLRELLGPRPELTLLLRQQNGLLTLDGSGLRAAALDLELTGGFTPAGRLDLRAALSAPAMAAKAGLSLDGPAQLTATGTWDRPQLQWQAKATRYTSGTVLLEGLNLQGQLHASQDSGTGNALELTSRIDIDKLSTAGQALPAPLHLTLDAAVRADGEAMLRQGLLEGPDLRLELQGQGRLDGKGRLQGHLGATGHMAAVQRLGGNAGGWGGDAQLEAEVNGTPAGADLTLRAGLQRLAGLPEELTRLLGAQPALSGRARLDGRELRVEELKLNGAALEAKVQGQTNLDTLVLRATAELSAQAAALPGLQGPGATGQLKAEVNAQGTPKALKVEAKAAAPGLELAGLPLRDLKLDILAPQLPAKPSGTLRLSAQSSQGPLELNAVVEHADARRVAVKDLVLSGPGTRLSGHVELDPASLLASGHADLQLDSLTLPGLLLGKGLQGHGQLGIELRPEAKRQTAEIQGRLSDVQAEGLGVTQLDVRGQLRELKPQPAGQLSVQAAGVHGQGLDLQHLRLQLDGRPDNLQVTAGLDGTAGEPVKLDVRGGMRQIANGQEISLASLSGAYGDLPLKLHEETRLQIGGSRSTASMQLSPLRLSLGPASISAQGHSGPEGVGVQLELLGLPMARLPLGDIHPDAGTGELHVELSGPAQAPQGQVRFRLAGLRFPTARGVPPVLEIHGESRLTNGTLSTEADMLGLGPDPVHLALSLPASLSLTPAEFRVAESGTLSGSLKGQIELARLVPVLELDGQILQGQATVDLQFAGQPADPEILGMLLIDKGRFEDLSSGTIVANADATLRADGHRVLLEQLSATDGNGGRMAAVGWLDVGPEGEVKYEVTAQVQQATLVRRRLVTGQATGQATLSGGAHGATVTGHVTLDRAQVNIPEELPPALTELKIEWRNAPAGLNQVAGEDRGAHHWPVKLDLQADIPGRLFVRGRGMESEFSGRLQVAGVHFAPQVHGELSLVRGRLDFLNIPFSLEQGVLSFEGQGVKPYINVLAQSTVNDITADVRLTGRVDEPHIELSSTPELPEDEIIARLLFGKSVGSLSPLQAVRLAMALRSITGAAGGPDVTGNIRGLLTLDDLNLNEETSGGYSIEAGKYLTDKVYLKLEKGLTTQDDTAGVQIELAPRMSLESDVGRQQGASVGLFYKLDY